MKKYLSTIFFSALGAIIALISYQKFFEKEPLIISENSIYQPNMLQTEYQKEKSITTLPPNFTDAAEKTLNAVVHVKNTSVITYIDPWDEFFYGQRGAKKYAQIGTGSGVIFSEDGYIITNNHVVKDATSIEVTLNNKKVYEATLVGNDATNDIALLKIDAENLPSITFGDSDSLKVGEWVLAVGNPYNLTSTVTAGIVSAKARDLKGNTNNSGENIIDSFIQTDAAVNAGNSGGALVNTRGELVGINTAISSKTGAFVGYSFAIPSNIAKKITEDILEYGTVQQAVLGVRGRELNNDIAKQLNIENTEGYYVVEITPGSGAEAAGLLKEDIIVTIDGLKVATFSDLKGVLNSKKPDDNVEVTYIRNRKKSNTRITLSKNSFTKIPALGIELRNLQKEELRKKKISHGVMITDIFKNELKYYGVQRGYIMTAINGEKVKSIKQVIALMSKKENQKALRIEILNNSGEIERYIFK